MSRPLLFAVALPLTLMLILSGCGSTSKPTSTGDLKTQRVLPDPNCDPSDFSCTTPTPPSATTCDPTTDPTCSPDPAPIPPAPSRDKYIEVYVDTLYARQVTDTNMGNSRDEVYMIVDGSTAAGNYSVRLPRRDAPHDLWRDNADYYGFTNQQNSVASDPSSWVDLESSYMGRPMIYSGQLRDGQSVSFDVMFMEQDNADSQTISTAVKDGLSAFKDIASKNIYAQAAWAAATGLADLIPTVSSGDTLGGYTVRVVNEGGKITSTWLPVGTLNVAKGTSTTNMVNGNSYAVINSTTTKDLETFNLLGTSNGIYQVTGAVETVDATKANYDRPLIYLGKNTEACGSDNLIVSGVQVAKNQTRGVNVSLDGGSHWWNNGSFYHWNCDGSDEQSKTNSQTEYVIASHYGGSNDRDIHFAEFKRTDR